MRNTEILKEIIETQKEYIKILSDELNEMGKAIREKISQLESKLFE